MNSLIPGYPIGSDLTIINTYYKNRHKDENGNVLDDYLIIYYRDNKNSVKKYHKITAPEYTWYYIKDDVKVDHNLSFIENDPNKVEAITCKFRDMLHSIAERTNNLEFFFDNIRNGNHQENRKLFKHPRVMRADLDIENYYRAIFAQQYTNNIFKLNKAYLDIEVDGINSLSDFPEPGECPINAIAYFDEGSNTLHHLLLDNNYIDITKYKSYIRSSVGEKELKDFIISKVGGEKRAKLYGVNNIKFMHHFYRTEEELLIDIFKIIRETNPDIGLIWNMSFDMSYILARILKVGLDYNIIVDERISEKYVNLYVDERNYNVYAERGDRFSASMFTVWLCEMINFASIRKGRGTYPSYRLDDIGQLIAGVKKLDFSHITSQLKMLPYLDFKTFSWYNIMDVIVQKCIESKTKDTEYCFNKCLINNTGYNKAHRQSVYLHNRFSARYLSAGFIIGNNINKWNKKPEEKYPGALVGDPTHNSKKPMKILNGRATMVADNSIDLDYKALYPSITLENNMAAHTQLGSIDIPEPVSYNEHYDMYVSDDTPAKYRRGGEFLENMMCINNVLEFCKRWLHLASISEFIDDAKEYFNNNTPFKPLNKSYTDAIHDTRKDNKPVMGEIHYNGIRQSIKILDSWQNIVDKDKLMTKVEEGAQVYDTYDKYC